MASIDDQTQAVLSTSSFKVSSSMSQSIAFIRCADARLALAVGCHLRCPGGRYNTAAVFVFPSLRPSLSFLSFDCLDRIHSHTYIHHAIPIAGRKPLSFKICTKALVVATVVALASARFSREGLVQEHIAALFDFSEPGQAATLAGRSHGVVLRVANGCDKVCGPGHGFGLT